MSRHPRNYAQFDRMYSERNRLTREIIKLKGTKNILYVIQMGLMVGPSVQTTTTVFTDGSRYETFEFIPPAPKFGVILNVYG